MGKALQESFLPILGVLGLLFVTLMYVSYEVVQEADEATVITIRAPQSDDMGGEMAGQLLVGFAAADQELAAVSELVDRHQWTQAEKRLQQLTAERNDSSSWAMLGILRYKQQRYKDALHSLDTAAQRSPLWPGLFFYRALVNTQLDAGTDAVQDYRRLIEVNPSHFEAHYNLGLLLLRQDKAEQAEQVFKTAAGLAGGARRARSHYQWGRALLAMGQAYGEQAREQFNRAIRFLPGFVEPRLALARMEPDTAQGRRAAEQQLLKVLELAAGNPPALFALAQHYSDSGDAAAAITRYRELLQFEPEHSAGHYNLGLLLLNEKSWREALEQFDWVVEREPNNTKALFNRGRTHYRLKRYPEAIADYRLALELQHGEYPEALLNIGLVQTALKDYAAAEQSYRQAVAQRDDYATAWYNLGLLHMRQKQTAEAVAAFTRAVSLNKRYLQAWYNLGVLYGREGLNEKAIAAYEEALHLRPDYTTARLNLAVRWMRVGEPYKAIEHYRTALTYDPTYSSAWYNLALAYHKIERFEDARDALQKMLELEPDNVKALQLQGKTLALLKQHTQAVAVLEHAVDVDAGSSSLRLELAQSLRASGNYKAARREIFKGLSLDPENTLLQDELKLTEVDITKVEE